MNVLSNPLVDGSGLLGRRRCAVTDLGGRKSEGVCYYPRRRNSPRPSGAHPWPPPTSNLVSTSTSASTSSAGATKRTTSSSPSAGLDEDIIHEMSWMKGEPQLDARLPPQVLRALQKRPMPNWGGDMSEIFFDDIFYYIKPTDHQVDAWDELPDSVKETYEKLGIPEAERKYLAGVTAQYESEVVYHRNREDLEEPGRHLLRHGHRAPRVPRDRAGSTSARSSRKNDNKFAALNSAVWSGGSFIYVPPGVKVEMPLQAYFRINAENMGQFERTLIIADEGSQVHYIEGCSAPVYTTDSLHSAVVEIIVKPVGPGHLHDHPELVEQRLQPGHQAGPGRGRGPHGVDRRQHRQPPHHEVPGGLHGRPEGLGRGALGGLRRRRPAPGRRRQDGPRRAGDHLEDRVQVDLQGRRSHQLPRPGPGRGRRLRLQEPRAVRRPHPRRRVRHATPSPTWRSAPATRSSATRPPSRRSPTSSSST